MRRKGTWAEARAGSLIVWRHSDLGTALVIGVELDARVVRLEILSLEVGRMDQMVMGVHAQVVMIDDAEELTSVDAVALVPL